MCVLCICVRVHCALCVYVCVHCVCVCVCCVCVCANNTPNGAMKNGGGGGGGIMNGKGDIPGGNGGRSWGPGWPSCCSLASPPPFLAAGPSTTPAAAWAAAAGTGGRGREKRGRRIGSKNTCLCAHPVHPHTSHPHTSHPSHQHTSHPHTSHPHTSHQHTTQIYTCIPHLLLAGPVEAGGVACAVVVEVAPPLEPFPATCRETQEEHL